MELQSLDFSIDLLIGEDVNTVHKVDSDMDAIFLRCLRRISDPGRSPIAAVDSPLVERMDKDLELNPKRYAGFL